MTPTVARGGGSRARVNPGLGPGLGWPSGHGSPSSRIAAGTRARVRAAGRADRGDPAQREPVADAARRGRDREDRATGVPDRVGGGGDGKAGALEFLIGAGAGVTRARAEGVESEMELPFASLHQLCAPMLD